MAPQSTTTNPTTLTARLVTSPATNRARPNAVTNGQGVGAGTSIISGVSALSDSDSIVSLRILMPQLSEGALLPGSCAMVLLIRLCSQCLLISPVEIFPILRADLF